MLTIDRPADTTFDIQYDRDEYITEIEVDALAHIGGGEGIVIPI